MFSFFPSVWSLIERFMKERFKVLLLSGIVLFACYYSYDVPSALNRRLINDTRKFDTSRITYLYSVYALPNIICPLIVGAYVNVCISILSQYLCMLIFGGQVLLLLGVGLQYYPLMLLGRFVYGLGGESFIFVQSRRITSHFKDKELALSLACFICFGRLGTISTYILTPFIAEHLGSFVAVTIGVLLTMFAAIVSLFIDTGPSFKRIEQEIEEINDEHLESQHNKGIAPKYYDGPFQPGSYGKTFCLPKTENSAPIPIRLGLDTSKHQDPYAKREVVFDSTIEIYKKLQAEERVSVLQKNGVFFVESDSVAQNKFHLVFYIYLAMAFLFSCVWTPFYNIAPLLFQEKYQVSNEESGKLIAIIEGISMFFISITSIFSDFIGYKLLMVLLGSALLTFSHLLIYFSLGKLSLVIFLLGFASPLISCYWPCMPHLVSEEKMTTGLALFTCLSNFSYTLSPAIVSFILSFGNSFDGAELFFVVISFFSMFFAALLFYCNKWYELEMNKPQRQHLRHIV